MIPIGAISFVVHLAIVIWLFVKKIILGESNKELKKKENSKFSLILVFLIVLLVFNISVISIVYQKAVSPTSNIRLGMLAVEECVPIKQTNYDRKIVLRVDDIQADSWRDIQMEMISDAIEKNITLNLAVIPYKLDKDPILNYFLRKKSCNLEFALHGNINNFQEFVNITKEEANAKLKDGTRIVEENLRTTPVTFIPPNNALSNESRISIYENGFKIISSGYGENEYDYDVTTFDYDSENKSLVPVTEIIANCEKSLNETSLCIIMIHPQNYADGANMDRELYEDYYLVLLDEVLKIENASIVNFKDLIE